MERKPKIGDRVKVVHEDWSEDGVIGNHSNIHLWVKRDKVELKQKGVQGYVGSK